jgi:phosphoribosylformimino-5-aminoimidazole carboxamide ribotide isomerase
MILWPAVDIRGGHAVRLARGDFARETVYDADPLDAARRWLDGGARALHVVDLDGAREGRPANLRHVRRIAAAAGVPVEVGGGLRDPDAVAAVLAAGASRAVLGTAALRDPSFAERMVAAHGPERIVVSVDARGGRVAAAGWTAQTDARAEETLESLAEVGVERFVYSNIERDGMLAGPDLEEVRRIAETLDAEIVYSGGVRSAADLADLAAIGEPSLAGVIVGTALFEGRLTVAEGQAALDQGTRTSRTAG